MTPFIYNAQPRQDVFEASPTAFVEVINLAARRQTAQTLTSRPQGGVLTRRLLRRRADKLAKPAC